MDTVSFFKNILLFFLIMIIGLYAGMHFFHEMCPVETQMTPLEYAKYWKIVDGTFMHKRMGVMAPLLLLLFVANIIINAKNWKSRQFFLLTLSLVAFLLDVGLTVTQQLPINEYINGLDLKTINPQQLTHLTSFQKAAMDNFGIRFIFSMLSFSFVCVVPFVTMLSAHRNVE